MKIGDFIVIFISIGIAVLLLPIFNFNDSIEGEKYVVIKVNGEVENRILMNEAANDIYEFQFDSYNGAIEIKDEKVRILKMPKEICPKSICSATGWISGNKVIVCLPNQIIVEIETLDNANNSEIDTVSS